MRHCAVVLCAAVAAAGGVGGVQALELDRVFGAGPAAQLAAAAAGGDAVRVRELAGRSADVNARGRDDVTLLQWALLNRSVEGLRALLEAGADPSRPGVDGATVLHLAAAAEDPAYLKTLLAHRADPNVAHARTGATPLMAALMASRSTQVRLLLEARADVRAADGQGDTALHLAAKVNDAATALRLLHAGADPRALNRRGVTFQRYLSMTPERVLTDDARAQRQVLYAWLAQHGVGREGS